VNNPGSATIFERAREQSNSTRLTREGEQRVLECGGMTPLWMVAASGGRWRSLRLFADSTF
jgi:hypothetical protein